jgi:NADH:ubiquinone oxidoreductase subunit 3 (subunit A)
MHIFYDVYKLILLSVKNSIVRLSVIWVWVLVSFLVLDISIYILANLDTTTRSIDWLGISTFLTAMAAFVGAVLYGKVQEKKIENRANGDGCTEKDDTTLKEVNN